MDIQTEIVSYSYEILNTMGRLIDYANALIIISASIGIIWLMKNRNQNQSKEKKLIEWGNVLKKGTK